LRRGTAKCPQTVSRSQGQRSRAARGFVHLDDRGLGGRHAFSILEYSLLESDGAAADRGDPGPDRDLAGPGYLGSKVKDEPRDYKRGSRIGERISVAMENLDSPGLKKCGKYGIVHMPLPIRISIANLVRCPRRKILEDNINGHPIFRRLATHHEEEPAADAPSAAQLSRAILHDITGVELNFDGEMANL
jgi:hypothetical protein